MIRTIGGCEVEIVASKRSTWGTLELELRRVSDGKLYHRWQRWGLTADGGSAEIEMAIQKAPLLQPAAASK